MLITAAVATLCGTRELDCYAHCRLPHQLEHISSHVTNVMYSLAETAAIDPAVVTDTVSNKKGGFFGPLASVFEGILKVCFVPSLYDVCAVLYQAQL